MTASGANPGESVGVEREIRDLANNGQLRRLPTAPCAGQSPIVGKVTVARLFEAPVATPLAPELPGDEPLRAAELPSNRPVRR